MKTLKYLLHSLLVFLSIPWGVGSAQTAGLKLGPFEKTRPREMSVPQVDETFSEYDALHGSASTPEQCAGIPGAFWIGTNGEGVCIRTYSAGLPAAQPTSKAIVYLHGDAILRSRRAVRTIGLSYLRRSPSSVLEDVRSWHEEAGVPVIFVARPGLYGSSGDHNRRRLPEEIDVVDAALDRLRERHGLQSFILTGQSGGGHLAAALVNRRNDVEAAVISSGLLSVSRVMAVWDRRRTIPGWLIQDSDNFYDPIDEIEKIPPGLAGSLYILSDPEDHVIPFATQLHYVRRLRAAGLEPHHFYVTADDPNRHGLYSQARQTASMIAKGASPRDVLQRLQAFELERLD